MTRSILVNSYLFTGLDLAADLPEYEVKLRSVASRVRLELHHAILRPHGRWLVIFDVIRGLGRSNIKSCVRSISIPPNWLTVTSISHRVNINPRSLPPPILKVTDYKHVKYFATDS